jgi:glutathione S-transferase
MAQAATYEIWVKGSPEKNELGDCPFSHRTMLTMEEKGVSYHKNLLDENKMPDWIEEKFGKKQIPFIQITESGEWMMDSDKIVPFLDEKHPTPKLGTPDTCPKVAQKLFPTAFTEFLTSSGDDEKEKEAALIAQLKELNDYVEQNGPYIGGQDVCEADLRLAPQLYHVKIGAKTIKDWSWPASFTALEPYLKRMMERPSWKNTFYTEKYVSDGWKLKVKKLTEE